MPVHVEWVIRHLPGYPEAWRNDDSGAPAPASTSLTWVGARDVSVRVSGARPGSARLFVDQTCVDSGRDTLFLPAAYLDVVGWMSLRVEAVDPTTGVAVGDTHELGVVLDAPAGAWSLPVEAPPLRPWVRAARLAARLGAGSGDHLDLLTRITRSLHAGIPHAHGRRVFPTYSADPRYLPDRNPPWDLRSFLDWLDAAPGRELPIACDGAVALVGLLGTVLGAEVGAARLVPVREGERMHFQPFRVFGGRPQFVDPMGVHQLLVVDQGEINPVVLDPTFDWDERGLDPPLPLRLYLSRRLQKPVEVLVNPPVPVLADAAALSTETALRRRAPPTAPVLALQRRLFEWASRSPSTRAVWDTTKGGAAVFRVFDRWERRWAVIEAGEEAGAAAPLGLAFAPAVAPRVTGRLPSTLRLHGRG